MIWIVTDSAQELKTDLDNGLVVMDLPLMSNGEMLNGVTTEQFCQLLEDDSVQLSTSQASPAAFEKLFDELCENGDEVICLALSSNLSGTWNSARLAALDHSNVILIDTLEAALSQSAMVKRAMQLRDQGLSAVQIADQIEKEKGQCRLLAAVATLKYLKKGGRISPAAAAIGDLAGIKPIVTVDEKGLVAVASKTRGVKKALKQLVALAKEEGIDPDRPIMIGYSGLNDANARELARQLEEQTGIVYSGPFYQLSPVLSVHAGPECAGMGYFVK